MQQVQKASVYYTRHEFLKRGCQAASQHVECNIFCTNLLDFPNLIFQNLKFKIKILKNVFFGYHKMSGHNQRHLVAKY